MGVYISEINMPQGEGSKLVLQIFPNGEVYDGHGIRLGIANWAEAIPVPPHGALMDRDEFFATCPELVDGYKQIADGLVVIEAEEGSDARNG